MGSSGLADANCCLEWINNKVLLYSTGNYIQYPVINHNGKNMNKNAYICVTESLCCRAEINTTLQINYTSVKKKRENTKTGQKNNASAV